MGILSYVCKFSVAKQCSDFYVAMGVCMIRNVHTYRVHIEWQIYIKINDDNIIIANITL